MEPNILASQNSAFIAQNRKSNAKYPDRMLSEAIQYKQTPKTGHKQQRQRQIQFTSFHKASISPHNKPNCSMAWTHANSTLKKP